MAEAHLVEAVGSIDGVNKNFAAPEPYAPGQFPRVGYPIWSASTTQYDFRPVADDEAITVIDRTIEEMRTELATLKDRASGIGAGQVAPTTEKG